MTRSAFKTLRLLTVTCTALLAAGCATLTGSIETPTVRLIGIDLVEAGLLEQRYALTLRVNNPNGISLPIEGLSYAVRLAGIDFASGQTPGAFRIDSYGDSEVEVEVSTNLLDTMRRLKDWFGGSPRDLDYELTGEVRVDIPFVGPVPFSESGTIALGSTR